MAGRLEGIEKGPSTIVVVDAEDNEIQPKKLKQARLPFKPLDFKLLSSPSSCPPSGNGSKKRKLSGQDSPHVKSKMQKPLSDTKQSADNTKHPTENENEVSSSSEAENLTGALGKGCKGNTLEKFVCRESLQEEITSTNVIDLTDSHCEAEYVGDENERSPMKLRSPQKKLRRSSLVDVGKEKPEIKQWAGDSFVRKLDFTEGKTATGERLEDDPLPKSQSELPRVDFHAHGDSMVKENVDGKGSRDDDSEGKLCNEEKFSSSSAEAVTNLSLLGNRNASSSIICVDIHDKHQEEIIYVDVDDNLEKAKSEENKPIKRHEDAECRRDSSSSSVDKKGAKEKTTKTPRRKRCPLSASTPLTPGKHDRYQEEIIFVDVDDNPEEKAKSEEDKPVKSDDGAESRMDSTPSSVDKNSAEEKTTKTPRRKRCRLSASTPLTPGKHDKHQEEIICMDVDDNPEEKAESEEDKPIKRDDDDECRMDSSLSSVDKNGAEEKTTKTPQRKRSPLSASTPLTPASANTSTSESGTSSSSKKQRSRQSSDKQTGKAALRQKVKEEKERQKREEKEKKEKERLEKKQLRDQEKAEKERQKRGEKEKKEKERQDKKERAEKEKQEKLQQKEEERKKKQEMLDAKMEEKRKKEEEKRLKDEEKQREEEEKLRQVQKTKEAFQNYFIKPKTVSTTKVMKPAEGLFIPFELKKDMSLAPSCRRPAMTDSSKTLLDGMLQSQAETITYLQQIRQGTVNPVQKGRVLRRKVDVEQEVELMVHDSETVKKVMHAVKLLQFHTDYRPPYYGTWRKQVKGLSPRNPWKKDQSVFDYELDSDEEWEEEEPGESLSDSNGEDEEAEGEEDDDDGWMVPHGYLSEGEGCEDDEEVTPETLKARQRAKAQAWEAELKAKKQVAPPVHLGCYWQHTSSCLSEKELMVLAQFEMVCLQCVPIDTRISNPSLGEAGRDGAVDKPSSGVTPGGKGSRKRALPDEAMPDLIRLVHGNPCGIKKLVREFRLFWRQKKRDLNSSENETEGMDISEGDCVVSSAGSDKENIDSPPLEGCGNTADKSPVLKDMASVDSGAGKCRSEDAEDCFVANNKQTSDIVSKRQLELKIISIAHREKRSGISKTCWYVRQEVLNEFNMSALPLENSWVYISEDMNNKTPCKTSVDTKAGKGSVKRPTTPAIETQKPGEAELPADVGKSSSKAKELTARTPRDQPSIMNFAKKTTEKLLAAKDTGLPTDCKKSLEMLQPHVQSDPSEVPMTTVGEEETTNAMVTADGLADGNCIVID